MNNYLNPISNAVRKKIMTGETIRNSKTGYLMTFKNHYFKDIGYDTRVLLVIHTEILTGKMIWYMKFASKYEKGEVNKDISKTKLP